MIVNGKDYPLWGQFVENKAEWIGGVLIDSGDSMDRMMGYKTGRTEIVDISLKPNGDDSAFFEVQGKDFNCGFDVHYGGIGNQHGKALTFSGYGGQTWSISKPGEDLE